MVKTCQYEFSFPAFDFEDKLISHNQSTTIRNSSNFPHATRSPYSTQPWNQDKLVGLKINSGRPKVQQVDLGLTQR